MRRLLFALASGLGSGYAPVASGTAGTLAVIPLYLLLAWGTTRPVFITLTVAFLPLAILAAGSASRSLSRKDPGVVVVDEWAGFLVTMAGHPLAWQRLVVGFFLFRLFDVIKPFPARQAEGLPGGYGIVLDDVLAGLYANAALWMVFLWG
ncbi:MAG: phosphatidylglycerophosphatase A [Acidobacteriota bacterium]